MVIYFAFVSKLAGIKSKAKDRETDFI